MRKFTVKILEIRKSQFKKELYVCGHRVLTILRMGNILETLMKNVGWIVGHYSLRQRGIELPADSHHYWSEHFQLVEVSVGQLRRVWVNGSIPLKDSMLVRYLKSGDERIIRSYYEELARVGRLSPESVDVNIAHSKKLFNSLADVNYDPSVSCIVINENSEIIDGYHRSSALFARYGADHKILVLQLLPDCR